jgi:uncharacterized protein
MSRNLEAVRSFYDRFNRGDDDWTSGIAIEWPPDTPDAATGAVHPGLADSRDRFERAWSELNMDPQELVERGDHVLALVRYRATARTTGAPLNAPFSHLFELRDGRIVRLRMFMGHADGRDALDDAVPDYDRGA